jgi:hypothetical protein
MFELEVLVEILFIDIIVAFDLEEFFKLFGEVISLSRFLSSRDKSSKARRAASEKELEGFMTPNKYTPCVYSSEIFFRDLISFSSTGFPLCIFCG